MSVEEQLRKNITALLKNVGEPGNCRGCKAPIFWLEHRNGKPVPYTPEGLNHFADCPVAQQFRQKK